MIATKPPVILPAPPRDCRFAILGLTFGLGLLVCILLIVGVTGFIRLGRDTAALRRSLLKSTPAPWDKQVEINVGSRSLDLARTILHFVKLDPNARTALESLRAAEVGVYRSTGRSQLDHGAMLSAADKAMTRRGWDRLVCVIKPREFVAVYVPRNIRSPQDLKVCVAVVERGQMVVASVRSNLEPLMQLAVANKFELGKAINWQRM